MFDGSTGGRGFEVAYASHIWGAVVVIAVLAWFWFRYDIRRSERDDQRDDTTDGK